MTPRARLFPATLTALSAAGALACEPPCEKTLTCPELSANASGQGGAGGANAGGAGGMLTSAAGGGDAGGGGGSTIPTVVSLSAGYATTCAALSNGDAYCWGDNGYGQLGLGHTDPVSTPQKVLVDEPIAQIASGHHTCAVTTGGATYCWGANESGQLGLGISGSPQTLPQLVSSLAAAEQVSVGFSFTCARLADTTLMCWGDGAFGKLGAGQVDGSDSPVPLPVVASSQAVNVATSYDHHACASISDGSARCWGRGSAGQLGDGQNMASSLPVLVAGLSDVAEVAVGFLSSCARIGNGSVYCWGDWMSLPAVVPGLNGVTELAVGYAHACAVAMGSVRCWGRDIRDPSGNTQLLVPELISLPEEAVWLAAGHEHACAVGVSQNVYCWGSNVAGQLGDADIIEHSPTAALVHIPWSR